MDSCNGILDTVDDAVGIGGSEVGLLGGEPCVFDGCGDIELPDAAGADGSGDVVEGEAGAAVEDEGCVWACEVDGFEDVVVEGAGVI